MIRCIAMDLDDTLLDDKLDISKENRTALRKAMKKGIKILLASGRMVQSMKIYSAMLELDIPLIAYNGAVIQESVSGKILYSNPVPLDDAFKVIDEFKTRGIHINIYLKDELYMNELTVWGDRYARDVRVKAHVVNDIKKIMDIEPYKMLGIGEVPVIEMMQEYLLGRDDINLDFIRSKPHYLEILASGVSKGSALKKVTESWDFDRSEVMAIGDAPNDISMIEWAGTGVAVGNASEPVKKSADMIVATNNNNGVAEAINKIL